jgi:hypothetical protein
VALKKRKVLILSKTRDRTNQLPLDHGRCPNLLCGSNLSMHLKKKKRKKITSVFTFDQLCFQPRKIPIFPTAHYSAADSDTQQN